MMKEFRQATVIRYEDVIPLVDALKFYAEKDNYISPTRSGFAAQYDPAPSPIDGDRGERAREALHKQPQVRVVTAEIEK